MATWYEVTDGQLHGRPAKRIDVRCAHGGSTFLLLPAMSRDANAAAIDVLTSAHGIKRSCHCAVRPAEDSQAPTLGVATRTTGTASPMP